jgi:EAL domain-containing protein (putative c-di-GMP-specific phosphodiesterase class I)
MLPQSRWTKKTAFAWLVRTGVAMLAIVLMLQLARTSAFSSTWFALFNPVAGIGFSLFAVWGRSAAWPIGLSVAAWSLWMHPHEPILGATAVLASLIGPWVVWRRLQPQLLATSQPFARQTFMLTFMKLQASLGACLSALIHTAGVYMNPALPLDWGLLQSFVNFWLIEMCGALMLAPITWEVCTAQAKGGLGRFTLKLTQTSIKDWKIIGLCASIVALVGMLFMVEQMTLAHGTMFLLLPLLALHAIRATPLSMHLQQALVPAMTLTASAMAIQRGLINKNGVDAELLLCVSTMVVCMYVTHILLVTAHERRLALRRLEQQTDTDSLTSLLSQTGLYRKLDGLGNADAEVMISAEADSQMGTETGGLTHSPALIGVHMTNAESIEQLLGSHQSDEIERATAGALAAVAPKVTWARIGKAHFAGLVSQSGVDLEDMLSRISFAAVEARVLLDDTLGRPLWTVAAVTLDARPLPAAQVIMACLRRTEQRAQETRQIHITSVDNHAAQALRLEAEQAERIRLLIQRKELLLYAQPIVSNNQAHSLRHKYEILIRLRDASGSIISPAVFLPVAMRAGLMQLLDMAVMDQTFEWFGSHPDALHKLSHCAINLSGPTVANPAIAQRIAQSLQTNRLPAEKFTFEITESQAIANPAQAADTIRAIRACGCKVAIDDFGTGVATFDYIKRFEVDYIKIDGAFIKTLLHDPVDRVIVESMVKVAHQLKVRTVAEFVSSQELYEAVTALGVDESQGYVFGAPQPLHTWFEESAPT